MTPREILKVVRRKPFVPFRLTSTEGSTYEVRHPEFCLVSRDSVIIGLPTTDPDSFAETTVIVDVAHVVKLEPIGAATKGKKS
jgi:hypothetical protein